MNSKKIKTPESEGTTHFKRNVLLALIPVFGAIIVAVVTSPSVKCSFFSTPKENNANNAASLRNQAGKLNDHIIFRRYDDLIINMVEGLKPFITRDIFKTDRDSVTHVLGNYIKTIDTSYSRMNNTDVFFLKNQYEKGINLVQIVFDSQGKIFGLFSTKVPY